ncbi:tubulin-like doman-containing protein [Streptomyces fradiae]|uniref:tubulin-like doman-containing protein n=1 Tax=Streptomyces fradiae TaxID=1906 RepID=UPI00341DE247
MKIYQPMLFVGLGGTGGRIGAELERSLRRELCGPDGTRLVDGGRRAPYQLPDCLQFVYADFSEGDLKWHPQYSGRGSEAAAYARTTHVVSDLLPAEFESSPDVTRMLRVALHEETRDWLPPDVRQPRVAPLYNGAGQLPTVGRAALFATLRGGLEPVLRPLRAAVSAIGTSAGDLQRLGGGRIRGCDVFVAFSVAGGTGAGIYHDFLHLIGHEFRNAGVPGVKIYPLVVMPSAFPPEAGGGREAELNGARALVDISRLVDDQNMPSADAAVGDVEHRSRISVRYPADTVVRLRASTVQTAFLFSKPTVIRREDLRRSITALVMSLVGTELPAQSGGSQDDYQSFAESFINKGVERSSHAPSGIGYRGMSTTLAASLTVPVDDLAEIVAARLLAQAVRGMEERAREPARNGTERVREMFRHARVEALWTRAAHDVPDPEVPPRGSKAVTLALHNRRGDMEDALARLERDLARDMPRIVEEFQPGSAVRKVLVEYGPFGVRAVVKGLRGHPERVAEAGFTGMLDNRRGEPRRPPHVQRSAPQVPRVKGGAAGLVPARWSDPDVREAKADQDDWYRWRTHALWHHAWRENESRWRPVLHHAEQELDALVDALLGHAQEEGKAFAARRRELYRDDRKGVSYLLPPQNSLRVFYDDVVQRLGRSLGLPEENTDAAGIVDALVDSSHWLRALEAVRQSHGAAVRELKQVLEQRVKALFGENGRNLNDRPLLPSMELLLRAAAGDEAAEATVDARWLEQFRAQIAGLLPVGFTPDGNGDLKVLITYPQSEADGRTSEYLRKALYLPPHVKTEMHAVDSESITVVLFRSGMSLTDVSEVRGLLKQWSEAREAGRSDDFLPWRQRLGYQDDWLVSTEEDRQHILHRVLCAMWNGLVGHDGDAASPDVVRIRLQRGESATMALRVEPFDGQLSSWAGLLRAYERTALLEEESIIGAFCDRLMNMQPAGLGTTPATPSPLFLRFVEEFAPRELARLDELAERWGPEEWLDPVRDFWTTTLPGALDRPFETEGKSSARSLRTLYERHRRDLAERAAAPPPAQPPAGGPYGQGPAPGGGPHGAGPYDRRYGPGAAPAGGAYGSGPLTDGHPPADGGRHVPGAVPGSGVHGPGSAPDGGPYGTGPAPDGGPYGTGPAPDGGPYGTGPGPDGGPHGSGSAPGGGPYGSGPGRDGGPYGADPGPDGGPYGSGAYGGAYGGGPAPHSAPYPSAASSPHHPPEPHPAAPRPAPQAPPHRREAEPRHESFPEQRPAPETGAAPEPAPAPAEPQPGTGHAPTYPWDEE